MTIQWIERENWNSWDKILFDYINGQVMKRSTNRRLLIQARRQEEMAALFQNNPNFWFPEVIESGEENGEFVFIMKHVDWHTAKSTIAESSDSMIREFATRISTILNLFWSFDNTNLYEQPPKWISLHSSVMLKVITNCQTLSNIWRMKKK